MVVGAEGQVNGKTASPTSRKSGESRGTPVWSRMLVLVVFVGGKVVIGQIGGFVALDAVADFLDGRGNDGGGVLGVSEFEVHAAADILQLEHRAAPGGTGNGDLNGLGTEFGMTGDESFAAA